MLVSIRKSDIILLEKTVESETKINRICLARTYTFYQYRLSRRNQKFVTLEIHPLVVSQFSLLHRTHAQFFRSLALHLSRSFLPLSTLCIPLQTSLLRLVLLAPLHAVLPRNGHVGWGDRRRRNHQQRNHKRRRIGRVGCWNTRRNKFQIYSLKIWSIYPNQQQYTPKEIITV